MHEKNNSPFYLNGRAAKTAHFWTWKGDLWRRERVRVLFWILFFGFLLWRRNKKMFNT